MSIAFHFETNDQSEIINQEMKRYLRNYYNYQQDDWTNWLFITEFAFNVCTFSFTEWISFMTIYDFESRMSFDFISMKDTAKKRILTKKTFDIFEKMKNIWEFIKEKLITIQKSQKRHANKTRINSFEYKVNDLIWLFIKNIKTIKHSKN